MMLVAEYLGQDVAAHLLDLVVALEDEVEHHRRQVVVNLRHVEQLQRLQQVVQKLQVLSPDTRLAADVLDEHHQSLQQIRVDLFALVFFRHVYRCKLRLVRIGVKILQENPYVRALFGLGFL